uniref:Membrane-bound lytic murein transglycosylase F n=1 Tax=Candidatus Kentrum eta TaxID=2126337 RepID=A0A450V7Y5_9GAMM|nr:MAG: membrane-bound lytic murein transglycosylase F [Candidatus Kentron sp. H]VFJ94309.1 MAG: membrane-bound lytic murein transglycosylase F [Candidatus Kentron sp. H]VFK00942.1 MAG: membrane-bound lytic murein transglycosylase F [Candidatus Kentron sp. H]
MRILTIILMGLFVPFCSDRQGLLEQIERSRELRVVTRNSLTTCYRAGDGFAGFEYSLARRFAETLGVRLTIVFVDNDRQAMAALERGEGHLAAGLRAGSPESGTVVRWGPVYQQFHRQVVYRYGGRRPDDPGDLAGRFVEIASGHGYGAMLGGLADKYPDMVWRAHPSLGVAELLSLVLQRKVDLTIADAHELALLRQGYPELGAAFTLGDPQSLVWGVLFDTDDGLYLRVLRFFEEVKRKGELATLMERYYGHMDDFDYVETHRFLRHVKSRLPKYMTHFKAAAARHNLDWRLLSAIGYQESHWNPEAVSPTGVRGIMMLTADTARQVGVRDRTDERESILGGARYFVRVKKKIPTRIQEPDRTWLALAAYNVGFGHLEDARILTQRAGADPDLWRDVKRFLPLISQKQWYEKTRYGYARGHEPVQFVGNIRRYYDRLVWLNGVRDDARL